MNQKNIFTGIAALLLLQGVAFFFMSDKMAADVYPTLTPEAHTAISSVISVLAVISIAFGLVTYTVREYAPSVWAYALGFALLAALTTKHIFVDHINVPMAAYIIQIAIVVSTLYLWAKKNSK